jgi:ribosomal protein L29
MASSLNFFGGMASGAMNQWRYQDQQDRQERSEERQDRLDDMRVQQFNLQQQVAQGQLDDQVRERKQRDELAATQTPTTSDAGFAFGEEGSRTFTQDPVAAQELADSAAIEADMAAGPAGDQGAVAPASGVLEKATGVKGGGNTSRVFDNQPAGMTAAKDYMAAQNDPDAMSKRYSQQLRSQGRTTEAMKYDTDYAAYKDSTFKSNNTALMNGLGRIAQSEGMPGLIKTYNENYKDGRTASWVPDAQGSGGMVKIANGNQVEEFRVRDTTDMLSKIQSQIDPASAIAARRAADIKAVDANSETVVMTAGGKLVQKSTGKTLATNDNGYYQDGNNADGSPRMVKLGAGGKSGKKSYDNMTPHEQSMSLIEDSSKDAEGAYKLTPDQTLTAKDMSGAVLGLNTNMSPQKAASIAVRVTADPSLVAPTLDMANGYVVGAYRDPNSGTRTSVYKFPQERITDDVKSALKSQIPSLLSSLNSQAQGLGPMVQRAAFGDAGASAQIYATLLQQNKVQLAQQFTSAGRPAPSDAQLTQAAQRHMDRNAMPLINRQIALVAAYGDKPAAQKGAQGAAGAGGGTRSIANTLDYVPPVNSIAGRSQSRRQANRAEADQAAAAQASRDQALASALQVKANAALRAANPEARMRAAQEIQESPDFDLLSTDSKLRISNAVNGR